MNLCSTYETKKETENIKLEQPIRRYSKRPDKRKLINVQSSPEKSPNVLQMLDAIS